MLVACLVVSFALAETGLTKIGTVTSQPSNCQLWGEGIVRTEGCPLCTAGFKPTLSTTNRKWSSTGTSLARVTSSLNQCNKISFVCAWDPFGSATRKDQRTDIYLIDPETKAETQIACNLRGENAFEFFYVDSNSTSFAPYIVLEERLDCKKINCNKYSLYDITAKRSVEVARLVEDDAKACTAADDGACYQLRVFPSPSGKLLAVVLSDDLNLKQLVNGGTTVDYYANQKVYFIEAQPLLKGEIVFRGKVSLRHDKNTFSGINWFKWDPSETYFGLIGYSLAPEPPFANFFVDDANPAITGPCSSPESLDTCKCYNTPTTSSYYRVGDGMHADDFQTDENSKASAYNCGN